MSDSSAGPSRYWGRKTRKAKLLRERVAEVKEAEARLAPTILVPLPTNPGKVDLKWTRAPWGRPKLPRWRPIPDKWSTHQYKSRDFPLLPVYPQPAPAPPKPKTVWPDAERVRQLVAEREVASVRREMKRMRQEVRIEVMEHILERQGAALRRTERAKQLPLFPYILPTRPEPTEPAARLRHLKRKKYDEWEKKLHSFQPDPARIFMAGRAVLQKRVEAKGRVVCIQCEEPYSRCQCAVEAGVASPCFFCEATEGLLYRYERTRDRGLVMACQSCLNRVLPKPTLPLSLAPLKYRVLASKPDLQDWWEDNVEEKESFTREPIDFVFPQTEGRTAHWNFGKGWGSNSFLPRLGF